MQQLHKASPELDLRSATLMPPGTVGSVLPLRREGSQTREIESVQGKPVVVGSLYITGDGTPESPLNINVPALTSAIINAMTCANFTALQNGIASCNGAGLTGGIGAGGD